MALHHDGGGGGRPTLPAEAGPHERALYEIYDFQEATVSSTASTWRTTAEGLAELAVSVRKVVSDLQRAPDGGEAWSGDAATAAYDSLTRLAANLDRHAEDVGRIEAGLVSAGDAIGDARTAYVARVRAIDIELDPTDFLREQPRPMGGAVADGRVLDQAAYDLAVAEAKAQREAEARAVMQTYDAKMETAARKLPVEPAESPVSQGPYGPGGGGAGGGGGGGNTPTGGGSTPPRGGPVFTTATGGPVFTSTTHHPVVPVVGPPESVDPVYEICTGFTEVEATDPDPVILDGDGGGTLGPAGGGGGGGSFGGSTSPGGASGGATFGGGGAAVGLGGLAAGGGAAALVGRGGPGASARPGVVGVGTSGTAARAGAAAGAAGRGATGGQGANARPGVVAAGSGQAAAARGAGGRGAAGGRTGRSGVPQLGDKGGRGGVAAAAGSAGGRGGSKDRDGQDVDHLTNEDPDVWFEDADDASPPVWR